MPLGASIVWGQDSTDHNGFRLLLRTMLEANGNTVTYVGTRFHGNMTNNACEAYPGDTIDEVQSRANSSGAWAYAPNVVLVHLGTNDCQLGANETSTTAAARFASFLASIKAEDADALVIASTLIRNLDRDVDDCIVHFNSHLAGIVRDASDGGQKVTLVDMHDAVPFSDINTTDLTHPTDAGYDIMARVWYEGLVNASSLITAPSAAGKATPKSPSSDAGNKVAWTSTVWLLVPLAVWFLGS
ncbi:hypothetical protein LTR36_005229 [Oleoguttula mirabilis]|uniref:SGNH hydrolase-type esterase domain-containing protein n=1 Tax=Oleoguttula mirabilis TaxID=1507867 RepID=A0AAV9JXR5_9PEZI|nr:hypothetical protein LTR36_005229 [Oleoguttula mirabilis]